MNKTKQYKYGTQMGLISICILMLILLCACGKNVQQKEVTEQEGIEETVPPTESKGDTIEEETEIENENVAVEEETETENENVAVEEESAEEKLEKRVAEKLAEMTLEEKVAQLFVITPEALTGYGKVTAAGEVTKAALEQYPVGGVVFFRQNIVEPEQLKKMTANLQSYSKEISGMSLFLGIDEEGGSVARIGNADNFQVAKIPSMREIGETGDVQRAKEIGSQIGEYLFEYGFNLDFAPVADVITNLENTVIGNRSFGTDASLVAEMSLAVAEGMQQQGIYSCMKHFPGHGATTGDTHEGYAYTEKSLEELKQEELIPFQQAIDNGISFMMVAHISLPNVIGDYVPASISKEIVTQLLREDMGYDGIVITDAMNMGAIANNYGSADAAIKAIEAGVDMILMPSDFQSAYKGVLYACQTGIISEERINQSVKRILKIKLLEE